MEKEKDFLKVENLVRDAFWNVYRPGAYEHYIVHNLRKDSSFIKDLAYVIEENDESQYIYDPDNDPEEEDWFDRFHNIDDDEEW